ncbi:mitogen-activated protein kinase 4-like [Acropora millepora]|uniref:mitogen-activated protein kinase 4-like n=1 Tax=Acropora millepora TaxID=45264 RepID=UPI001CF33015|nr:mitogen-activated protein kinase 4-like [Acropora millepora]
MLEEDISDFLAPHFTDTKLIGTGGSGTVYSSIDCETNQRVALKRLLLRDQTNCQAALREITILKKLEHDNVVKLTKVVDSEGLPVQESSLEDINGASELFLVEELLDSDLHQILQSNGKLREDYVKLFLYQILRGLKYIHSANIAHRDVKPSNILVDSKTLLLSVGDFGRSRIIDPAYSHSGYLTHRVSTLWYKAPELLLNSSLYDGSVDIWAAGCVFAEMLLGKPLFEGKHEIEQLEVILDSVSLTDEEWSDLKPQIPEKTASNREKGQGIPLGSKFTRMDIQALDLLVKMLQFNPQNRISAEEALAHPYLRQYSFPCDEPICLEPLHIEDEVGDFDTDILKGWIFDECLSLDDSVDPLIHGEVSEDALVETPDCCNEVLSLKDLMADSADPIILDDIEAHPLNGECYKENLRDDVTEHLGLESRKEGLDTLAAAFKIQMSLQGAGRLKDQDKNIIEGQNASMPSTAFLDSVFGQSYLRENVNFACKKNVFNGPFGLCYF